MSRLSLRLLIVCCIVTASLASTCVRPTRGQEPVAVTLKSGRSFTAWIDERTDQSTLWLRFQSASIIVRRPVAWDRIDSAEYRGEALSADRLRELAATIKNSAEDISDTAAAAGPEEIAADVGPATQVARPQRAVAALPIHSLAVDAELGNWDLDADPDGVIVFVAPLDGFDRVTPLGGSVEVRLLAPLRRRFHEAPTSGGASLEPIASWTRVIAAGDIGPDGAKVKLPFQAYDPVLNDNIGSFGMVHVKYVVPGHGVFERTVPLVRIRSFSPLRDWFGRIQ